MDFVTRTINILVVFYIYENLPIISVTITITKLKKNSNNDTNINNNKYNNNNDNDKIFLIFCSFSLYSIQENTG